MKNNSYKYISSKERKVRDKFKVFNYKYCLLLLIIIFIIHISEANTSQIYSFSTEIKIIIKGKGTQYLLNKDFFPNPSSVNLNGHSESSCSVTCELDKEENEVVLKFDESLSNCNGMFADMENIIKIDFSNFDFSQVKDMSWMFYGCYNLEEIIFGNADTSNLENMAVLFQSCSKLTSVDLSSFDLSLVKDMSWMFNGCSNLEKVEFGNTDTSSLENIEVLFQSCSKLTSIDLSIFDLSKVKDMSWMFHVCSNIEIIKFGNTKTSSLENSAVLFSGCEKLLSVNLSIFDFSKVTDISSMFGGCSNLENLEFDKEINTSIVEKMSGLFAGCSRLTSLDLAKFDFSKVKDMSWMFNGCSNLVKIDFGNSSTTSLENIAVLFQSCSKLTSVDLSNFDTSKVTNMAYTFFGCNNLKYLDLSSLNISNLNFTNNMFYGCYSLIYLNLKFFQITNDTNINIPFDNLPSNLIYCINDEYTKINLLGNDIISICSDSCVKENYTKIDINNNQCIDTCLKSNNKYEYKNYCYEKCPNRTLLDNYLCEDNACNFYSSANCQDKTPKGYYLDLNEDIYKKCFENCDYCNGPGNVENNNCTKCKSNFVFLNESKYETNCFEKCEYYYYFDYTNRYNCTEYEKCPEKFSKFIKDKNKCIDKCINDDTYKFDFNNTCLIECPNLTFILLYDREFFCLETIPNDYYLDTDGVYKKCYETCFKCYGKGNESYNNCKECKYNFSFYDNPLNITNCNENCKYYYYFDETNQYHCTNKKTCPLKYNLLILEENRCIDECKKSYNYNYEFENKCYNICPNDTILNESTLICYYENTFQTATNIFKNNMDENIQIFKEYLSNFNISENTEDKVKYEDDTIYQVTTSENQRNNTNKNISTIDLGDCEKELKIKYQINDSLPLIIFKIDYFTPDSLIPKIGYEIYHPLNKSKLDLSYCKDIFISLNIPVSIDEDNLFKYDPNNEFYTDNCFSYTTENGTDIILNDRKQEFSDNKLSLCENNCNYTGYDRNNKQSSCSCDVKNKMDSISEILDNPIILSNNFENDKGGSNSGAANIISIKCTKALFSKEGLKNNISSYILIIFIGHFLLSILLFIKCGFYLLEEKIRNILNEKEKNKKNNIINKNNANNYILGQNKNNKIIKKKKIIHFPPKKYNFKFINNRKEIKEINNNKKINSQIKNNFQKKRKQKLINVHRLQTIKSRTTEINSKKNIFKTKLNNKEKLAFNDFELNSFEYKNAILFDKRTFCQLYLSLLKVKNLILFSFFPVKDYNSMIIKLCIFSISFSIYYSVNFAFFNDEMIHKIYEIGGKYDVFYFIPKISISFAISYYITNIIKILFLSERNISEIRKQQTLSQANVVSDKVKRKLVIKYTIFFILGLIFLVFFWMLLSSFGAVYQNTQMFIFKNALISFAISLFYPFIINIFSCTFRICSLSSGKNDNECVYKLSQILQILL